MLARSCDECLTHFIHVTAVRHAHWKTKTHSPIGVSPVRHWRIDEFLVWHNHGNVVVRHDKGAAGTDLLYLAGDACDFDAISDGDGALSQNEQPADEIAGDVF